MAHFPFLALPKELRLMVYERIPNRTRTYSIKSGESSDVLDHFMLVEENVTTYILATCRQVNSEAQAILDRKMLSILESPIRLVTSVKGMPGLMRRLGPLRSLHTAYENFLAGLTYVHPELPTFHRQAVRKIQHCHKVRKQPALVDVAIVPHPVTGPSQSHGPESRFYRLQANYQWVLQSRGKDFAEFGSDIRIRNVPHMPPRSGTPVFLEDMRVEVILQQHDVFTYRPRTLNEGPTRVYMGPDVKLSEWEKHWTDEEYDICLAK
ncbi:hypothetical protein BDV95DRAFT_575291 [Massariosphaeria phaeospora]|uniref:F-box domain-containing protein n=1 Tax=Massariosphaeria phaeospora TaxID=100035 RepID=A0A7C8I633_9PLEO|nr:hypothetical protein BDV95DRAFT_575291 [Massariosphaeria phaeospora]